MDKGALYCSQRMNMRKSISKIFFFEELLQKIYRNFAIDMGLTKTEHYTEAQIRLAALAKALGHPARITILQYLAKQKTCVCGSIVEEVGLAQATVSQHLKALKEAGLIIGSVEGTTVCYCLAPQGIAEMSRLLNALVDECCDSNCC